VWSVVRWPFVHPESSNGVTSQHCMPRDLFMTLGGDAKFVPKVLARPLPKAASQRHRLKRTNRKASMQAQQSHAQYKADLVIVTLHVHGRPPIGYQTR